MKVAVAIFQNDQSLIGTDNPEIPSDGEGPVRPVKLTAFTLETMAVTNNRFAEFVKKSSYLTEAERFGFSAVFAGLLPDNSQPSGSSEQMFWWLKVNGASWLQPEGPQSSLEGRWDHPVTHISWADAERSPNGAKVDFLLKPSGNMQPEQEPNLSNFLGGMMSRTTPFCLATYGKAGFRFRTPVWMVITAQHR